MASEKMSLKLLVHKATQKVLYAEAPKEFVDFLLHLFSLPLGTMLHLVGSKQMAGCLGTLKESVETLNPIYFQPDINKDTIINSKASFNGSTFLQLNDDKPTTPTRVYTCYNGSSYSSCRKASLNRDTFCPICRHFMTEHFKLIAPAPVVINEVQGFVKEAVTYMVTDDLIVKPLSTSSSIAFMDSFRVKDLTQIEEKTLLVGEDEALELLKASLSTNAVLTTLLHSRQVKEEYILE